jgi:DNA helicase II / ATP-dependent DNA helicase PcrA
MNIKDFFYYMEKTTPDGTLPLNEDQKKALEHDYHAPLWMIAGPGTGKTHTLVWLVLKRMFVDQVTPERIFLTTFTKKAAAELEARLIFNRNQLVQAGLVDAKDLDLSKIRLGTLHSLCSRILNEERYEPTLRVRVLEDEIAQRFFIRRFSNTNGLQMPEDISFWRYFGYSGYGEYISKSKKIQQLIKLFNRMTENQVNIDDMLKSNDNHIKTLADCYQKYTEILTEKGRLDQSYLQLRFLQFLKSPEGQRYIDEGFTVLVDEYQDTNPIQEEIYFRLAGEKADFTVVGDDDQSLYRFRGATVESLIRFDETCDYFFNRNPFQVNLNENRRSHSKIIEWVNRFIEHHPHMQDDKIPVRAPGKRKIVPGPQHSGNYPAVMAIDENNHIRAGIKMGQLIKQLYDEKMIKDYSQVALLTFSTKETVQGIKQYVDGLAKNGIPYYNPRNKTTQKNEIFLSIVGAIVTIMDPDGEEYPRITFLSNAVAKYIDSAREAYKKMISNGQYQELERYVDETVLAIDTSIPAPSTESTFLKRKGGRIVTLSSLLYKLLAHEPFHTAFSNDVENSGRLNILNVILSEYESLYSEGQLKVEWDDETNKARIDYWTLNNFYSVFIDGIHDGLNDPEDEEISIQPGKVNIMTIHQSKGLEFEVVFVVRPDKQPFVSDTHLLEDLLTPFVQRPIKPQYRSRELRASEDAIRLFFVAYSRAKNLLILTGVDSYKWQNVLGVSHGGQPIDNKIALEREGVYIL